MNKSKKNTSPSFFSEIYGAYFRTVRKILGSGTLTRKQINKITEENAFRDSILYIPSSIIPNSEGKSDWGLLKSGADGEYKSLVKSTPTPMTVLQKRWLKSKLSDSRIKLFLDDEGFDKLTHLLEDVEPLYSDDTFFFALINFQMEIATKVRATAAAFVCFFPPSRLKAWCISTTPPLRAMSLAPNICR